MYLNPRNQNNPHTASWACSPVFPRLWSHQSTSVAHQYQVKRANNFIFHYFSLMFGILTCKLNISRMLAFRFCERWRLSGKCCKWRVSAFSCWFCCFVWIVWKAECLQSDARVVPPGMFSSEQREFRTELQSNNGPVSDIPCLAIDCTLTGQSQDFIFDSMVVEITGL